MGRVMGTTIDPISLRSQLEVFTQDEVASMLDVTKNTLREWRRAGKGPDYVRTEKSVFYRKRDILDWISLNVVPVNRTQRPDQDGEDDA